MRTRNTWIEAPASDEGFLIANLLALQISATVDEEADENDLALVALAMAAAWNHSLNEHTGPVAPLNLDQISADPGEQATIAEDVAQLREIMDYHAKRFKPLTRVSRLGVADAEVVWRRGSSPRVAFGLVHQPTEASSSPPVFEIVEVPVPWPPPVSPTEDGILF